MMFRFFRISLLSFLAILVVIPFLIVVSSSLKDEVAIFSYPFQWIPLELDLANYSALRDFGTYALNSFKVTGITVVVQLFTSTTAAYAFSKMQWRGRELVFLTYLASIMVPIHAVIIPQFIMVRGLGLYDTHLALVVVSAFTAFGVFIVRQYFLTIPDSLVEAAKIDGASDLSIYARIMVPMSHPVLAALTIFSFRFFWNDFFTPLIYIASPDKRTIPVGLASFVSEFFTVYGPQMAAAIVTMIPVLIVFVFAQRYFVEGIAATGLKG